MELLLQDKSVVIYRAGIAAFDQFGGEEYAGA